MNSQASAETSLNDQAGTFQQTENDIDFPSVVCNNDDEPGFDSEIDLCPWPKWLQSTPPAIKPYLTSFMKFPELPIEIRHIIWRLTLQPRTVEVDFHRDNGFVSRVNLPVALRVCGDSRKVATTYPLCFGSFLYNANIAFNFSLDTLYISPPMQIRVTQFLTGLSDYEAKHIQSIALDSFIKADIDDVHAPEENCVDLFREATSRMPTMKEFLVVYNVGDDEEGQPIPAGDGSMQLYDEFTYDWQMYMCLHNRHI